jgi:thioredoxin 1
MRNGFNLISGIVLLAIIVFMGLQLSTPVAAIPQDAVLAALSQAKPTIAEFGSDSCSTCKHMKQVLDQLQQRYADQVTVVHINIVKQPSYTKQYRIMLMPTQIVFDAQGRELTRHMGAWSETELLQALGIEGKP